MKKIQSVFVVLITLSTLGAEGSIVAVQPLLTEKDYRTVETLRLALEPYFNEAHLHGDSLKTQLIVFPEYLGTWIVAVDEPRWVFKASSLEGAMVRLILSHPFRFLKTLVYGLFKDPFKTSFKGRVQRAVFIMLADKMKTAYELTFSSLARQYRMWVVAGSILLPELVNGGGSLTFKTASSETRYNLMNQSVIFNAEGEVVLISKKVYPVQEELAFLNSGPLSDLKVVNTPVGHLGVLVCADSWYPDCYQSLERQGVDVIAVPSFVDPADRWEDPWKGYDPGNRTPADVDPRDVNGAQTEKAMWLKYALCGRMVETGARVGVNSFLIGRFWGLTGGGQSSIVERGVVKQLAPDYLSRDLLYYRVD